MHQTYALICRQASGIVLCPLPPEQQLTLGREHQAPETLAIPDKSVSHRHAEIGTTAGVCRVNDLGSTNGTKLNNQPIAEKEARYLTDGDQIAFGDVKYTYYTSSGFYDLLRSLSALR